MLVMTDAKNRTEKKIDDLKGKVVERRKKSEDARKDAELRKLRKKLKRAQRKFVNAAPFPLQARKERDQKLLDLISKQLTAITKNTKKSPGDPFVHSLRKKVKSLNRRVKKATRLIKKREKPVEGEKSE